MKQICAAVILLFVCNFSNAQKVFTFIKDDLIFDIDHEKNVMTGKISNQFKQVVLRHNPEKLFLISDTEVLTWDITRESQDDLGDDKIQKKFYLKRGQATGVFSIFFVGGHFGKNLAFQTTSPGKTNFGVQLEIAKITVFKK